MEDPLESVIEGLAADCKTRTSSKLRVKFQPDESSWETTGRLMHGCPRARDCRKMKDRGRDLLLGWNVDSGKWSMAWLMNARVKTENSRSLWMQSMWLIEREREGKGKKKKTE